MDSLLKEIRSCTICTEFLPLGPNPQVQASPKSRICIIGQAPGKSVHESGIPWNDPSGIRLRDWLGVDEKTFYDPDIFALVPMGFCYPGKGKSGDLPPRPECAPTWHDLLLNKMTNLSLIILIGQYAQNYYLKDKKSLTDRVKNFKNIPVPYFALPHPSPRNNIWMKKNQWFGEEVLPALKKKIAAQ